MGLFGGLFQKISHALGKTKIDDSFYQELEEQLILSDVSAVVAVELTEHLRTEAKKQGLDSTEDCEALFRKQIGEILAQHDHSLSFAAPITIFPSLTLKESVG